MTRTPDDLARFAREHHLHYDVEPEFVDAHDERKVVAFDVRLFAMHDEAALGAPGCEKCVEIEGALLSFAQQMVAGDEMAARAEVIRVPATLYESAEERGKDEVAVTVRVRCDSPNQPREGSADDACTRELCSRLADVGVRRT